MTRTKCYKGKNLPGSKNASKILRSLPDILRKNGFTYIKVLREGRSCIYEQIVTEKTHYFEVFSVKVRQEQTFNGKFYPEHEVFPADSDFGKTAWSFRHLDDAMVRFNRLVEEEQSKGRK